MEVGAQLLLYLAQQGGALAIGAALMTLGQLVRVSSVNGQIINKFYEVAPSSGTRLLARGGQRGDKTFFGGLNTNKGKISSYSTLVSKEINIEL